MPGGYPLIGGTPRLDRPHRIVYYSYMNQLPTKFRIHVTAKDCRLGCKSQGNVTKGCAVARPVIRKLGPLTFHSVVVGYSTVELRADDGGTVARYNVTDISRMERYTESNDRGFEQTPTSFTFVREF